MFAFQWLCQPIFQLLTLTLLHFVWQGLAIALALTVLVELCGVRRVAARYACSLAALLAMTICPIATLVWLAVHPLHPASSFDGTALSPLPAPFDKSAVLRWLETVQPYALVAWFSGVTLFGSRLLIGAVGSARLRRGRLPLPSKLAAAVECLGRRMQIDALPLVFLSRQVAEAMAVGLVRPLVLIPASWTTEMPLEMLEAVIAHELAHLWRRDLWVNLLQRIVETLLFYHPAVWWLSRRLRTERELCCDELAVAATGRRLVYVEALEIVARRRAARVQPALAAGIRGEKNMRLLERVRYVLCPAAGEQPRLWPAGLVALVLPLAIWGASLLFVGSSGGVVRADDEREERGKQTAVRDRKDDDDDDRPAARKRGDKDDGDDEKAARRKGEDRERPDADKKNTRASRDEDVERKVITRDGKRIVEVELARGQERGSREDRRVEELTVLVKRLAAQVERLQDEVASLRGDRRGDKGSSERREQQNRIKRAEEEREEADVRKRAVQEAELAKRAVLEKVEKALIDKKRAAEDKARAAREEEAEEGALKRKLRELKDRDIDSAEAKGTLLRNLRDKQSLILGLENPKPKDKPQPKKPAPER